MNYTALLAAISDAHQQAQTGAAGAVNRHLILRNWLIGAYLVEFEQNGDDRAEYGLGLLKRVSADLRRQDIPGTSTQMLERMRLFYIRYPQLRSAISSSVMRISSIHLSVRELAISSSPPMESPAAGTPEIRQPPVGESSVLEKASPSASKLPAEPRPLMPAMLLSFSWTHLLELIRLDDPWKRAFYENECLKGNWSVRQLQRQIGSLLYERTGLSADKQAVIEHARQQATDAPTDIASLIRDPYVLEFTGLAEKSHYLENDLETALLDHLQSFLLELGTGFCFEARQKRITVGNEHDYLDLVFYHRLLRCHLLIDLKIRAFQHADAGQMNFYLNYWKENVMAGGDQPPVGLLLCTGKDQTKVEYATGGMDHQLFVSRYLVALPKPEQLQQLIETDRAVWEQRHPEAQPEE
jgi:predicted nuclease of restriction endonuclease-like (RecB) superfamily